MTALGSPKQFVHNLDALHNVCLIYFDHVYLLSVKYSRAGAGAGGGKWQFLSTGVLESFLLISTHFECHKKEEASLPHVSSSFCDHQHACRLG